MLRARASRGAAEGKVDEFCITNHESCSEMMSLLFKMMNFVFKITEGRQRRKELEQVKPP